MISLRVGKLEFPPEGAAVTPYWTLEKLTELNGMKKAFHFSFSALFGADKSLREVVTWSVGVLSSPTHLGVAFSGVQGASQDIINFNRVTFS